MKADTKSMVMKKIWRELLVLLCFPMMAACQSASPHEPSSISAGALAEEYAQSPLLARSKYDGKEIVVRGCAAINLGVRRQSATPLWINPGAISTEGA